nr:hypothetical protein [uncultured Actinoplanes sp.]
MTVHEPDQQPAKRSDLDAAASRWARVERRRDKIRTEIERNREGGHKVPTWALAAILGLVLLAWLLLIITS